MANKRWNMRWNGGQVLSAIERAAAGGIDEVMSMCVPEAKMHVPVATSALQGSIKIVEPARRDATGVVAGIWGSADIVYALGVETGDFSYLRGTNADVRDGVPTKRNKGNRGSLRRAADAHYGKLPGAIARRAREEVA